MKKTVIVTAVLAAVVLVTQAQALIIQAAGENASMYSETSGWAYSSGAVTAPGLNQTVGSRYSGAGTYFGPTRQAVFSFTPTETELYDISLAWPSTAGEKNTAVVLYTGASSGADLDPWGNAGPGGVIARTTMDMYYRGTGVWNLAFDDVALSAGTTYKVGIYAGYKSPGNDGVASNRVAIAAAQFTIPEPATLAFLALGGLFLRRRA